MSITHITTLRNEVVNLIVDKVDLGSANAQGRIYIKNASGSTLVILNMSNPAFGAAATGIAIANTISSGTVILAGTAATFSIVDRDEATVFSGTVGALGSGADLEADGLTLAMTVGQVIPISSFTYNGFN